MSASYLSVLITLLIFLTFRPAVAGAPHGVAYVVLSCEVVAIDMKSGRCLQRLDFTNFVRPGEQLTYDGRYPVVRGGSDRSRNGGQVRIDLRRMRAFDFKEIPPGEDRFKIHQKDEGTVPTQPAGVKITQLRSAHSESQAGRRLIVQRRGLSDADLVLEPHPKSAPFERLDRWTVTPDGRRIVILTSSGFKYQSYLHVYDYASMRRISITPVMKIRDHVPLGLFVL